MARTVVLVLLAMLVLSLASSATPLLTDPAAVVTCTSTSADFFKDLSAYGKYGTLDSAADILYNGDSGSWNFGSLTGCLPLSNYASATVTFSLAADDQTSGSASNYTQDIYVNGALVSSGSLATLEHGTPYNGPFTNWKSFSFTTTNLSTPFIVSIHDTYADNGWLGIDSIDVKLELASSVPEPSSLVLLASSMVGALALRRRLFR